MRHDDIQSKCTELYNKANNSQQTDASIEKELNALYKNDTFSKLNVDVVRYSGNGKNELVVNVTLLLTGEQLHISTKEFLKMSDSVKEMINKYGNIESADLEVAKSLVKLYMASELTAHDISEFNGYSNSTAEIFDECYEIVCDEMSHNADVITTNYKAFLENQDAYIAVNEQRFRGGKNCWVFPKENLMAILEIEDNYTFTEIMKAWKRRGYLYVSDATSNADRCQVKYHGKQCYAVVVPNGNNGGISNSGSTGSTAPVQKAANDIKSDSTTLALPEGTKISEVSKKASAGCISLDKKCI